MNSSIPLDILENIYTVLNYNYKENLRSQEVYEKIESKDYSFAEFNNFIDILVESQLLQYKHSIQNKIKRDQGRKPTAPPYIKPTLIGKEYLKNNIKIPRLLTNKAWTEYARNILSLIVVSYASALGLTINLCLLGFLLLIFIILHAFYDFKVRHISNQNV